MKPKIATTAFVAALAALSLATAKNVDAKGYTSVDEYPLPDSSALADPDGILSDDSKAALLKILAVTCQNLVVPPKKGKRLNGGDDSDSVDAAPVQIAVAIVERLNQGTSLVDTSLDTLTEKFAKNLHDKWGVGYQSPSGGTGALLFVDVHDRIVYISRGGALDKVLSDSRIDKIIEKMRPSLRRAQYGQGIEVGIEEIARYVQLGDDTLKRWQDAVCVSVLVFLGLLYWLDKKQERDYARVSSQLTQIDQAKARALQGVYQPQTSCPICLEDFKSKTTGSDDGEIKLLRCGHVFDESCWSEWVSSGRGNITKCPVCRLDVGRSDENSRLQDLAPTSAPTEDRSSEITDVLLEQSVDNNRALRLHQQERNFRLLRLSSRYPNFVTSDEVARFSSPTYNGRMAQDSQVCSRGRPSNGGSGFSGGSGGGGFSSGGRGGRF